MRGDDERRGLVRDQLAAAGWQVQVAHARKVRDVAPLACKTDKVDARVLAELCRRDLVPELWVPSLEDRALRERLRRRTHLVRLRASAQNRIFGLLTQWGLRLSVKRLREPDAMALLEARGVEATWRRSIAEALAVIGLLDARIAPLEVELRELAKTDPRVALLRTIPGVGDLLGLTIATEIGDVSRFATQRKLIGYAGLAPKVDQSGDRSRTGALSKAGSRTLRWAAVEAAHQAWRESNPWHELYTSIAARAARTPPSPRSRARCSSPAGTSSVAASLQARRLARADDRLGKLPLLSGRLTAPHGIEKPRQPPRTICALSAEREMSTTLTPGSTPARSPPLTTGPHTKRKQHFGPVDVPDGLLAGARETDYGHSWSSQPRSFSLRER